MKYEDISPALRAGRIVRRQAWKEGYCLIWHEAFGRYGPSISQHYTYDRRGSYGTWSSGAPQDLLAEDWEIIPELDREGYLTSTAREALTELALQVQRELDARRDGEKNLSVAVHELIELLAAPDRERLRTALVHGILAWMAMKKV